MHMCMMINLISDIIIAAGSMFTFQTPWDQSAWKDCIRPEIISNTLLLHKVSSFQGFKMYWFMVDN